MSAAQGLSMSEHYEDEQVARARALSNGQVTAFIAGF
jgi:hypothetical protein